MAIFAVLFLALAAAIWYKSTLDRSRRFPPGPKPDPIIGNLRHVPSSHSWRYYTDMRDKYGDVFHFSIIGQSYIVLNSAKAAADLFVKRASIYSDRPRAVMLGEIMGQVKGLIMAPYGTYWRTQRRLFHQHLSKKAIEEYWNQFEDEARSYVMRLHKNNPMDFVDEFRLTAVKLILGVTYGLKVNTLEDEYATLTMEVNELGSNIAAPGGGYFVDLIPALLYVPSWFPGANWKRQGKRWAKMNLDMVTIPYEQTKRDLAAGKAIPSFTTKLIEDQTSGVAADEECQKWLSGAMYSAGGDTTLTAYSRFLLGILHNPNVQTNIQEELDRVVGQHRLPTLADKDNLPYVDAVIRETLRWNILTPIGLPHRLTEDDEYEGYLLPKGATIIPNNWAISQDPEMYPNPSEFRPERFLPTDKNAPIPMDPRHFVFGYGRRICPGMHFAELVVYSTIVSLLSTSNILRPLDKDGNEYLPDLHFTGGILSSSEPFPCRVEPRSTASFTLLSDAVADLI